MQGMTEDIAIWERQKGINEDRYVKVFASDVMYEQNFNDDKKLEMYEARNIT